jgi:NAD(P)-dependent dehydrogenase (short-subunit alcohol dehydrogenase family)
VTNTLDLFDMTKRHVIVSGGAGLLGPVFAEALLDAGAVVHLLDVDAKGLEETDNALSETYGDRVFHHVCDITDKAEVTRTVQTIEGTAPVEVLINAAAINPKFEPGPDGHYADNGAFSTYSLENWHRSLEVNLTGMFLLSQSVSDGMMARDRGVIINIASTYGLTGPDQRIYENASDAERFFKPVDYSVTKAGALGFTRALAAFFQNTKVRVNALSPGGVDNNLDADFVERYAARTVLGRMARADEYRGAMLFLCSDASSYMTGANLVIDGGWTAL